MQIFTDKRHWWKVEGLLGSSIQINTLPFTCATNSQTFSQTQRWMPRMSLISVCVPRKLFFLHEGRAACPQAELKSSNGGAGDQNEQEEENDDARLKSQSLKRRKGGVRWATGRTQLLIIVAVTAIKQPCGTTCRTGWEAEDLRAMTLLNSRAHSCSITVNLQSIPWPTTHEWNLAAFADASILEKRKIRGRL